MNLLSLANDFNCDLILEGIEDEATAMMAAHLGIPLGQGYFFARPADPSAFG
jgi:EAL domain-containing protein (putative c-di-GMP-specific phosphodiesterase class I)